MIFASASQFHVYFTSRGLLRDCEIFGNLRIAFVSSSNLQDQRGVPGHIRRGCVRLVAGLHQEGEGGQHHEEDGGGVEELRQLGGLGVLQEVPDGGVEAAHPVTAEVLVPLPAVEQLLLLLVLVHLRVGPRRLWIVLARIQSIVDANNKSLTAKAFQ